ncbi:MAG: biotin/lipoyl-binding protein, partial [Coleofasciculus sp. C2-GNP5-27]
MPSENTTATPDQANTHVDNGNQQQRQDNQATAKKSPQQPEADQEDLDENKSPQSSQLKTKLKKAWWLIPLVGLVLAIGGVSVMRLSPKDEEAATTTQPSPLPVRVTPAQLESIRAWVSSEGNVRATRFKHLTFDVDGDVTYIANREGGRQLREGDRVQKGELLARIDDRELQAQVSQAQAAVAEAQEQKSVAAANLAQAQAQVAQAHSQVSQAQAQLAKARSNRDLAQSQLERYRLLYNQGVIPASEFDTRQNTLQDAQAQIQAAQAQVQAAQDQVQAAQAQVQATREQVEAAETGITTARAQLTQAKVDLEGT